MTAAISNTTAWILLVVAGVLEVVWAISMKASEGFTKVPYTVVTLIAAAASFWLLGVALKSLPVGTAYAIWTGIGAVGAAVVGVLWLGEPANAARIGCVLLIVLGILGLKFTSGH